MSPSSPTGRRRTGSTPTPHRFTLVDGVEKAITAAKEFAGDRVVDVAAGHLADDAPLDVTAANISR